jgi:opacity protein-like surface antigen
MKKVLAVAILSISLATPAFAEESPIYAGALLGNQYVGVLGGYQIDKMYSVEISYATVLTPTVNFAGGSSSVSDHSLAADLVVMLPWKVQKVPELSFFAKGGAERHSVKVSTTGLPDVTTNEIKLKLGGGAQYDVTKNFVARAGLGVMGSRNDLYVSAIYKF